MNNTDTRSLIGCNVSGHWRELARSTVTGQAVVELQQYVNKFGKPQSLYRTTYGLEQKDWDKQILAEEEYQSCVLHQWGCAGFNDGGVS